MLLLLDAGNTRLKWAVGDFNNRLRVTGATDYSNIGLCVEHVASNYDVTEILVSSVAGEKRNQLIVSACKQNFNIEPKFARVAQHGCGIENKYRALERLGVDRWVAVIGSADRSGVNRIIVDAGTAVTVDFVDADNVFLGGVILPGGKLMHDSLVGETAGIDSVRNKVTTVIGETTHECVNAGVQYGLAGAIDRIIDEIYASKCNDGLWQVLLCGGDAELVADFLKSELSIFKVPDLLFFGLLNLHKSGGFK